MSSWPPAGRAGPAGAGIGGSLWNHAWLPRAPGLQGECVSEGMGVLDTDWQTVSRKVTPIPTWQLVPTPSLGLCSAASWGQLCVSGQGTKGFVFECSWSLSLLALPTPWETDIGTWKRAGVGRGSGSFSGIWGQAQDASVLPMLHEIFSPEQSTFLGCCIPCWEQLSQRSRGARWHPHFTSAVAQGAGQGGRRAAP